MKKEKENIANSPRKTVFNICLCRCVRVCVNVAIAYVLMSITYKIRGQLNPANDVISGIFHLLC